MSTPAQGARETVAHKTFPAGRITLQEVDLERVQPLPDSPEGRAEY